MAVEKLYMTVAEACGRYGIGRTSLCSLFALDECQTLRKFGNRTLIPVRAFDEFFEKNLTVPKVGNQDLRKFG